MSATVTTTSTSVDPADTIEVGWPRGRDVEMARPWVRVPHGIFITMPADADEGAAAWWRQLAHSAALVARWYDQHETTGGAR